MVQGTLNTIAIMKPNACALVITCGRSVIIFSDIPSDFALNAAFTISVLLYSAFRTPSRDSLVTIEDMYAINICQVIPNILVTGSITCPILVRILSVPNQL